MAGNQYQPDPRQIEFLKGYLDPKSETFADAMNSALKAGYAQEYAENITHLMPNWLSEAMGRRKRMLEKAEKRGEELLDSKDERVVADLVKHFTRTLGREHYSERTELTGKDGKDLPTPILNNAIFSNNSIKEDTGS